MNIIIKILFFSHIIFCLLGCSNSNENALIPVKEKIENFIRNEKVGNLTLINTENDDSESLYDTHLLYIINNENKKTYKLFSLSRASIENKLISLGNGQFSYEYFTGGNSVNAECYQLIEFTENNVYLVGIYKGFEDIDNDKKKDFYVLVSENENTAAANQKYKKEKLKIINHIFEYPKNFEKPDAF